MSVNREHHLHGIEQVTIPPGFDSGALASLCVEVGDGNTCSDLVNLIYSHGIGNAEEVAKFRGILTKRLGLRGAACLDERYSFRLTKNGLKFFDFEEVPSPLKVEGVTAIEWLSDLTNSVALNSTEMSKFVQEITN